MAKTPAAVVGVLLFAFAASGSRAQPSLSPKLTTTTQRVVAFKNGHALFCKRATGTLDESGRIYLAGVPDSASLGSFWAAPEKGTLRKTVANRWVEFEQGRQQPRSSLSFQFDPTSVPDSKVAMAMEYFRPGLRWIPTYRVSLGEDDALLEMQAEIMNEAEDLEAVDLRLVVGTPNFQFKDVPSPVVFEANLVNPLTAVAPAMMQQSASNYAWGGEEEEAGARVSGGAPWMAPELGSESVQDLFVYEVPRFTLGTGERAIIPILSGRVPVEHVYTWEVNVARAGVNPYQPPDPQAVASREAKEQVWHAVDIRNATERPWTTGPAFFNENSLPIAQGVLKYTSTRGKCRIPLTPAPDVTGELTEREIDRQHDAGKIDGRTYTRIRKHALLRVISRKSESIQLEIECEIGGNAKSVSDGGESVQTDFRATDWPDLSAVPAFNGHSTATWSITLEADATKDLSLEYEYFVWP